MNPPPSAHSKAEFVELCIKNRALCFGQFTLKSGRVSPYFFNAGLFNRGLMLGQLAEHYAQLIATHTDGDFMLYGPAYKGIPLAAAVAVKLAEQHGRDVGYAYNRKEAKDHGEGGRMVGAPLRGQVVIIDDVITAGTSIRESVASIWAAGARPHSVALALDRRERAGGEGDAAANSPALPALSAAQQVAREHGIAVRAIINLDDLVDYLEPAPTDPAPTAIPYAAAIRAYRDRYGIPG